jgi:hypothetical protein
MVAAIAVLFFAAQPIADADEAPAVSIVDQRPTAEQHPWQSFTINIGSCDYGVWQLSEAVGVGDRLGALRNDLASRLDASTGLNSLIVTRYDVFLNRAVAQRGFAVGVAAASQGGYAAGGGPQRPSCERARMTHGWFDPSEVTTPYSPLIVEIAANANGRSYTVRSVYSPSLELSSQCNLCFGRPLLHEPEQLAAFRAAMTKAHEALAAEINGDTAASQ